MNINLTEADNVRNIVRELNALTESLNHLVEIYPQEQKAYEKRRTLSIQKTKSKYEYSKLLKDRHHQEQIIAMAVSNINKLKKYQILKKFRLKQKIKTAENAIEGIKEELIDIEQNRRQIVSDINAIALTYEFSSSPDILRRRFYSIVQAYYNPKVEEYNSLTGEKIPALDPQEFKTIAPINFKFALTSTPADEGEPDEFS